MKIKDENERVLIQACQGGDKLACGVLYEKHIAPVYRFIYLRVRHKETAEDLTSETFLKAFSHFENFETDRPLLPWLYRIAHNTLIDHWRKEKPNYSLDENWDTKSDELTPIEKVIESEKEKETMKEAMDLLDKLNPLEKTVVTLRLWNELPYREIANVTDKTEAHTKVIFSRAMAKLRQKHI